MLYLGGMENTAYLLMGPNGGKIVVCGVYADEAIARSKALRYNRAEENEGFPASEDKRNPLLYSVEAWVVQPQKAVR